MNILVLGATGRVGAAFIEYALAGKHHVTALVRDRAKIQYSDPHLEIIEGNLATLPVLVERLEHPLDVVVNVVGGNVFQPSTVVTESAEAALSVMKQHNIMRYLAITGVAQMQPCGVLGTFTISIINHSPIRHAARDHQGALTIVKESGLDWTLAACPYIRDGQHTSKYKVVPDCFPGGFHTISPQDVADFLLKEMQEHRFPQQAVGIWY